MEPVSVGILSLAPPVIAIVLALLTKEVILSLTMGIAAGALIYSIAAGINPIAGVLNVVFELITSRADLYIMVFCFMLGGLVFIIKKSGGSEAYGRWAEKRIRGKRQAQLLTALLGCVIFIDDYFNALTVGTVMQPVTDRFKVSRAKLAFLIDATSAPICILMPISSWGAAVGSYLGETGAFESDLMGFLSTIPFNFYALLCLIMVAIVCIFKLDFGTMQECEEKAEKGDLGGIEGATVQHNNDSKNGTVADMLVPILVLVIATVISMLYIGGFWGDEAGIAGNFGASLGNSYSPQALVWASFITYIVCFLMYIPRKLMNYHEFMDCTLEGFKAMMVSGAILMEAWAIGGLCRDLLSTPEFVTEAFTNAGVPGAVLPALVFVVAAFLSFSTGTSWGTFGILIPIVVPIAQAICPNLMVCSLGATLAGSIFGDHCSPISDTTILSSTGAGVDHLVHVSTQMVYSLTIAVASVIGYIVMGIIDNLIISFVVALVVMVGIMFVMHKRSAGKAA